MRQYLLDDHRVFDSGNHPGRTATGPALPNTDIERALHLQTFISISTGYR
jgi:hypothetical protein